MWPLLAYQLDVHSVDPAKSMLDREHGIWRWHDATKGPGVDDAGARWRWDTFRQDANDTESVRRL